MKVISELAELTSILNKIRRTKKSIGFSPTMGALHEGHVSLIENSKQYCDINVCSIFVNPAQFDRSDDLDKYPRTLSSDLEILDRINCDIVFTPSIEQIYPDNFKSDKIDLKGLDQRMEGAKRPGHFDGVVQVVKRLLNIVAPDMLFMGQKDFQQFTIIHHMIDFYKLNTKLIVCPIIREADGLAMSSRNVRLEPGIRLRAPNIYKTLKEAQDWLKYIPVKYVTEKAMNALDLKDFRPEYFEIVNGINLMPIEDYRNVDYVVACTAVWAGDVRLIDNMVYKGKL